MNKKYLYAIIFSVLTVGILIGVSLMGERPAEASAPSGYQTITTTSSVLTLIQGADLVIAATSTCTARIITTQARPITLKFTDDDSGFALTSQNGILQAASTTKEYDSAIYGCGQWTARNAGDTVANAVATIVESTGFK